MFDIDEIMKQAEAAGKAASRQLNESIEKSRKIVKEQSPAAERTKSDNKSRQQQTEDLIAANQQRQAEILGQIFDRDTMSQMAATQELIQKTLDEKVAAATANGIEGIMDQLFGEDMGIVSAALETLAMEEDNDEEEAPNLDETLELELYRILEEKLAQLEALPEPEPVRYVKDDPKWGRFAILLSGIISSVNGHLLNGMDVEEHIPVLEQKIVSLVRRSWGINGRSELLDTIRYLIEDGYTLRYELYCAAKTPQEVTDEDMEADERESICRGWRFAQYFKSRYLPNFLLGWDVGRAAMLARWGCYLGWITEGETVGILWELAQKAAKGLHNWREFARSYLFGGLMWKLICGDGAAESYLGYLADAATDLLTGKSEDEQGQWRDCPWPQTHKIGFYL